MNTWFVVKEGSNRNLQSAQCYSHGLMVVEGLAVKITFRNWPCHEEGFSINL